ncbi:efflux RND transporter periplasmic adaptor subunit [Chitinophaga sp. S165]|uniref:efflux RND transporter periplasmic adaptor subunit n=1 Tax=Chitinophaga sp. S165 TaxID=2135462 RepID=UPI000D71466E|nr:efflux RND transporter periplasmic adaptor subunit [Chitinophaga sp. S165]PWV49139.1 membrane fusion protein (multidrug efflux system) [Chitinophaga sp. S165]
MTSKLYLYLAIITVWLSACTSKHPENTTGAAVPVSIITVSANDANIYKEYPATVEGETDVQIRTQVNGILEKIYVDEGAYVTKGQLLFKVNDQEYKEQLNNASAELLAAQAAVSNAQLEVDKVRPLVESKVVAPMQLQTARSNYDMAVAREKQAAARVADANIKLAYTNIKAPVNGYIGRLNKKAGTLVAPADADALTGLSAIDMVHVYFSIGEQEFVALKNALPGATLTEKLRQAPPVSLQVAGDSVYPQQGKIDMVNGSFEKNSGAITLRASFPNTQGLLRSGNTGKIKLSFVQESVIAVPQTATLEIQDKIFVYTVNDSSKAYKKSITISGKSGNNYLIREGLHSGEKIVTTGMELLQDGTLVQPGKSVAQKQ